jgi:hypothetical protein
MRLEPSIPKSGAPLSAAVGDAVAIRALIAQERGEHELRRQGVRVERAQPRAHSAITARGDAPPPPG